ncbi:MAG TPA: DUF4423 domain-containing protein [Terriglobales bacterium]|nr:DUF4423 domain-containing protein [Terriglobales bacterium]
MGLSAEALQSYSPSPPKNVPRRTDQVRSLQFDLDTFQLLSTWHHYAILELTHIRGFKPDVRWIAGALAIEIDEVNTALQRLLRLGLMEMSGRNRWVDRSGDAEFHTAELPEGAGYQAQREIHELALQAIERTPSEHRVHRHMVVAFDSKALPRLHRLADEFMRKARALSSDSDVSDDVYELEISFFPVTALKTRGGKNG